MQTDGEDVLQHTNLMSGRNRSSTKVSMQSLVMQVRATVRRHSENPRQIGRPVDGVAKIFQMMDRDSNGDIDKDEMLAGLKRLGIVVSAADLSLIWPLLDADGTCLRGPPGVGGARAVSNAAVSTATDRTCSGDPC